MAVCRKTSRCISMLDSASINTRFVCTTKPSFEEKIDKETCAEVLDAAKTVKDGAKDVVEEGKRVRNAVTKKVTNTTENMVVSVAKKGFEKASENAGKQRHKDVIDTVKTATEAYKEKVAENPREKNVHDN